MNGSTQRVRRQIAFPGRSAIAAVGASRGYNYAEEFEFAVDLILDGPENSRGRC